MDCYAEMAGDAAAIAGFFFDLPGGKWALALLCETLEDLLSAGSISGAAVVIRKLYEAADQPLMWAEQFSAETCALFAGVLDDMLQSKI